MKYFLSISCVAVCLSLGFAGCGSKSVSPASSPASSPSVSAHPVALSIAPSTGSKAAMYHAQDSKSVGANGEYASVVETQKEKMNDKR